MDSYNGSAGSGERQDNPRPQNQRDRSPIPERRNEPPNRDRGNRVPDDDFDLESFNFHVSDVHSNISLRAVLHNNLYTKFNEMIHLLKEINHGDHLWMEAIQFTRNNVNSSTFEQRSLIRHEEQRRRYNLEMVRIQHEMYVILQKLDVVYRKIFVSSKMIHSSRFDAETEKRLESDYERNKPFIFRNGNVLELVQPFFEMIRNNAITDNREQELPEPPLVESDVVLIGRNNRSETGRERSANSKAVEEDLDEINDMREICDRYRTMIQNRPEEQAQAPPPVEIQTHRRIREIEAFQRQAPKDDPPTPIYEPPAMDFTNISIEKFSPLHSTDDTDQEPPELISYTLSPPVDVEAVVAEAEEDQKHHHQNLTEKLGFVPIPVTKTGLPSEEEEIFQMDDIETESTPGPEPKPEEAAQTAQPKGDLIKQRLAQFEGQSETGPKCKFVPRKSMDSVQESAKPPKEPSKEPAQSTPEEDIKQAPEDAVETEGDNLVIDETEQAGADNTIGENKNEAGETSGNHVVPQIEGEQQGNTPPNKEPEHSNVDVTTNIEPEPVVENKNQETQKPQEPLPQLKRPVGKQILLREPGEALSQQDADGTDVPPKARPVSTRSRPVIVQPVPRQPPPTPEDQDPSSQKTINVYGADYTDPRIHGDIPEEEKRGKAEATTSDDHKKDLTSEILPDSKKGGIPEAISDKREEILDINKKKGEEGIKKAVDSKEEDTMLGKEGDKTAVLGKVEEASAKSDIITIVAVEKKQVKEVATSPKPDKPPGVLKGNTPEKKEPEREEKKMPENKAKLGKENVMVE